MGRLLIAWILITVTGHSILGLRLVRICGSSMAPTIQDGDMVITISIKDCAKLNKGDVITFRPIAGCQFTYIKRIAALPNETIEARNSTIFVDGTKSALELDTGTWDPITVPTGEVFVLGDNRGTSKDSQTFGCVAFQQIESKMLGKIDFCRNKSNNGGIR